MTPAIFAQYTRKLTKTNSTTFPDSDLLLYMNIIKDDQIAAKLVAIDEEYFGAPQYTDLINGQREYPFPLDLMDKLKKVEAVLDPTYLDANNNPVWVDLRKFDLSQLSQLAPNFMSDDLESADFSINPTTDEDTIQSLFGNRQGQAAYMIFRRSLWIFSGVLTGFTSPNSYLKLWGYSWPADISNLASTTPLEYDPDNQDHGIPRQLHKVWADKVILMKKQDSDKAYQPNDYENELDTILDEKIASLTQIDKDESYTATQPHGGNFYNNGFDL